jgi:hypothetical protein
MQDSAAAPKNVLPRFLPEKERFEVHQTSLIFNFAVPLRAAVIHGAK